MDREIISELLEELRDMAEICERLGESKRDEYFNNFHSKLESEYEFGRYAGLMLAIEKIEKYAKKT